MHKRCMSNKEFERLTEEIHHTIGSKFKDHSDGDCEKLLFEFK